MGIGSGFQEMGYGCIMEFIPNKHRMTAIGECALVYQKS